MPNNYPDTGRLQINVLEGGRVSVPVAGALVRVARKDTNQVLQELLTDESGQSAELQLPAPPLDYSMKSEQPQPYSEYVISAEKEGFEPTLIKSAQIFPDTNSYQEVALMPTQASGLEVLNIDEPVLWGEYPPKLPESDVKPLPPSTGFVVLPEPVIPEFIVVHDGVPTNRSASNYWVPFKDYIKNVASCEIYANWPEATLEANILAIISFTLNRVYTEWYRAKGYNFTMPSFKISQWGAVFGKQMTDMGEISSADLSFSFFAFRAPWVRLIEGLND